MKQLTRIPDEEIRVLWDKKFKGIADIVFQPPFYREIATAQLEADQAQIPAIERAIREKVEQETLDILEGKKDIFLTDDELFKAIKGVKRSQEIEQCIMKATILKAYPVIERAAQGKEFSKWVKGFMDAGMAVDKPESVPLYIEVAERAAMERAIKAVKKKASRHIEGSSAGEIYYIIWEKELEDTESELGKGDGG